MSGEARRAEERKADRERQHNDTVQGTTLQARRDAGPFEARPAWYVPSG